MSCKCSFGGDVSAGNAVVSRHVEPDNQSVSGKPCWTKNSKQNFYHISIHSSNIFWCWGTSMRNSLQCWISYGLGTKSSKQHYASQNPKLTGSIQWTLFSVLYSWIECNSAQKGSVCHEENDPVCCRHRWRQLWPAHHSFPLSFSTGKCKGSVYCLILFEKSMDYLGQQQQFFLSNQSAGLIWTGLVLQGAVG